MKQQPTTTTKTRPRGRRNTVKPIDQFVAIILAHGRPDNCHTFRSLRNSGYTGRIVVLIDNEDKTREGYEKNFGKENVVVFDKLLSSKRFRNADNFQNRRAVVYARNESFRVAKELGFKYFMQLDDDYLSFHYRCDENGKFINPRRLRNLDSLFEAMLEFYIATGCDSVAMAQGGDYIGGPYNNYFKNGWPLRRKIMNSWLCCVDKPFTFEGRMNEDVSAYVRLGVTGKLFFTFFQAMLQQVPTQAAVGGMSETYASNGTYVKSFYTVMMQPSSVKISELGINHRRFHHSIDWPTTVPKILHPRHRK